ncbi:MAG: preprotein translocase subunit SecA [Ruminococcaceae bacterium]|jgi:preprotein translocase subunit SecA|nr:preprotein translocase subunit SecA [Oscillospiraceae bacterium]
MSIFKKIFGDYSTKELKRIMPIQQAVLDLEGEYEKLSDAELRAKTDEFKERLNNGETLDDILPEAFATCREASMRVLNMKHFPVQILGGIVLHQGRIAEMKTGEGKTLVATLPAYLNALAGKGVHIVTVNDYLARRDSEWMGKLYEFLGLKVGLIIHEKNNDERKEAYAADITYGTNNEMGFDYLRDNMVTYRDQRVQRGHSFAIVDEVDSILIDEARTPLIISGIGEKSTDLYEAADRFVKSLKKTVVKELDTKTEADDVVEDGDYLVDEKGRSASLTKSGIAKAEQYFNLDNLMDAENMTLMHHLTQALQANGVMKRDVDYVVQDGQVLIVDEFTGRIMLGRRYSDGLHQAIEAKEGVKVEHESKTLATITFQNYFRLYDKLSGMTGTAMTEKEEFQEIYSLDVIAIPTNKPMIRVDRDDVLYKTEEAKFNAIIQRILECHEKGQPVLVGTINIEKSEKLSRMLKKQHIQHEVLNAKFHAQEAEIIAQAGKFGAVTIATNMAGRGTDIILGGNPELLAKIEMRKRGYEDDMIVEAESFADTDNEEILAARKEYHALQKEFKEQIKEEADKVRAAGGLCIIGTERHESRRIDNQLRGRSGRQGDPGESQFFLSAEDDLLRLFAGDRFYQILDTFKSVGDMPFEIGMLTKQIENAQKKVEGNNFAIRRHVLSYDDVMNMQREVIYGQRNQVLDGLDLTPTIMKMIDGYYNDMVDFYCPTVNSAEDWNIAGMLSKFSYIIGDDTLENFDNQKMKDYLIEKAHKIYNEKKEKYGDALMDELQRKVLLKNVDQRWMSHIDDMEQLKQGISLRSYGQQDPVVAFRMESFDIFDEMTDAIREGTVYDMMTVRIMTEEDVKREQQAKITATNGATDGSEKKQPVRKGKKVGRNDPCPCGSGKKYKHCCGKDE